MSALDKQNKEQPIIASSMFGVSIMNLTDELLFQTEKPKFVREFESEMKRAYSEDVLSTISNPNEHVRYQFFENNGVNMYFSTYDSFERIYKGGVLDSLRLPIKIVLTNGKSVSENKVFYNLIIHILTDEAREFVQKSIQNLKK
uniref:Uncharacterized protein n=1 Tax=Phage sp. ctL4h4 TaxID=2828005 RepID=A0A8S5TGC9_9VIRU|nr:MAG TPA: hypothetical protein [Phage sp. ctL4h4]